MEANAVMIFCTAPTPENAEAIARELVASRLAACVNILPSVNSFFWWEGKVDQAQEQLLVIKTTSSKYGKIERKLGELHPYEVPEIIATPIEQGSAKYLKWLEDSVAESS